MNNLWLKTTEQLPPFRKYVLGFYEGGNWTDSDDPLHVNCVVVKLVKAEIEGNNLVPYRWFSFGPGHFFGQEISHWTDIPKMI